MKKRQILLSLLTLIIVACGGNGNNEEKTNNTKLIGTSISYDVTSKEPQFINAYIDVSTSMKGYFSKDTDGRFITAISNANPNRLMWMDKNFTEIKGIPTNKLLTGEYTGGDSYFHTMFERIIIRDSLTRSNGISLLFTDGIISASSDDTRKNPEFTPQTLPHFKNEITKALKKRKGIAMVIFMLNSKFDGYYYDYQNKPIKVSIEDRPFYVIAIGAPTYIRHLVKNNKFNAINYEAFGIYSVEINDAPGTIFRSSISPANWDGSKLIGQKLGLNVDLPEYIAELGKDYILSNMTVEFNGKDVTHIFQIDSITPIKVKEKILSIEGWKTTDTKLPRIRTGENTLKVTIKKEANKKWKFYKGEDDKDLKNNFHEQSRTFALEYLIEGVREGIEKDRVNIFTSEITFSK